MVGRILAWRKRRIATTTNTARVLSDDPREVPLYSLSEAAVYLGIAETTLRSWINGRTYPSSTGPRFFKPLIDAADPARHRLSFANLAEAHVLQATRDREIPMPKVRSAIDYVAARIASPHPLISADFHHFGKDLFLKQLEGDPINASRGDQLGIREILDLVLERLERDKSGYPVRIFPMRTNHLVLDVNVAAGQPVVRGTRIPARVLWSRRVAGDSIEELATDYGINVSDVEEAFKHFDAA